MVDNPKDTNSPAPAPQEVSGSPKGGPDLDQDGSAEAAPAVGQSSSARALNGDFDPIAIARFESRINKTESCWFYTGGIGTNGYGQFKTRGRTIFAHRFSYALYKGPIPDGLLVCHRCDKPLCVKPDHLFLGTNADNMRDRAQKGRYNGEWNGRAKVTFAQVLEARRIYKETSVSLRQLARTLGLDHKTVRQLVNGSTWAFSLEKQQ